MASTRTYRWTIRDQVWFLGAKFLAESGFSDVSSFVEAIREANPQIISWVDDVAPGTLVTIPYLTS